MALSKKPYKGCRDFFPNDMRVRDYVFEKMRNAALSFGFEAYDGPLLEEVELYKAKSGEELINEQIYAFTDRGERHVAIRPEMTPTVARMVAGVHREVAKPLRWFSIPNLMRYEKPQKGRLREHWQFNCDVFGAPEGLGEIEIFGVLCFFLESFGANESMFSIQINDRRIVDALFDDVLSLSKEESYKLYKIVDKAKKVTEEALDKMVSEVITEPSKQEVFKKYLNLTSFNELKDFLNELKLFEKTSEFITFEEKLSKLSFSKYLQYDPTIVRGLDYYTGVVFEIFDKHPDNRRAIAGGGAYANLLQIFNESPLGGVGFGMGDVTLVDFLTTHNLMPDLRFANNDLYLCYLDDECEMETLDFANKLRLAGLKVESNLGSIKFKKIFPTAEKKGHRFVAMMGSSEKENNEIQIKNLQTKEGQNFKLTDIEAIKKFIS